MILRVCDCSSNTQKRYEFEFPSQLRAFELVCRQDTELYRNILKEFQVSLKARDEKIARLEDELGQRQLTNGEHPKRKRDEDGSESQQSETADASCTEVIQKKEHGLAEIIDVHLRCGICLRSSCLRRAVV